MANVGTIDRIIRFIVGFVHLAFLLLPPTAPAFAELGVWRRVIVAVGVVMTATPAMRSCLAYTLLDVTTCERT